MPRKIAVAFDGSESSRKALREAIRLTLLESAELEVVSVEELPRYAETIGEVVEEKEVANHKLEHLHQDARQLALEHGVEITTTILVGHPAKALINHAGKTHVDLLVIGHSGHSGWWASLLGDTAYKLVRTAPCSVLLVR